MPQFWFIAEALVVLAKNLRHSTTTFTRADLTIWSKRFAARRTAAQQALDHLATAGMVRRIPRPADAPPAKPGTWTYVLTPEGAAAAKAAYAQWKHQALSAAGRRGALSPARAEKASFCARLWALFRMRKVITAPEAAATLVDAGGDVRTATNTASQYLRQWKAVHGDAIQVGAQNGAHGTRRYVLVKDLGPVPPVTTAPLAQGGAVA